MMKISEVQVLLIKPKDGLIGFASLVLEDQIYLGSIGIHQKLSGDGYRITYPTKSKGSQSQSVFHPIRREIGLAIEEAILTKLKNVMRDDHARHRGLDDS